ncbi:MAG: DEAD/DEAH box helicase [Cumulibacter sp.]
MVKNFSGNPGKQNRTTGARKSEFSAGGRKPRHGQVNRAERRAERYAGQDRPRRYERDHANESRADRFERGDARGDRGRFNRAERSDGADNSRHAQDHSRNDRRGGRPERFGTRPDRNSGRYERSERFDSRGSRSDRVEHSDRGGRSDRSDRFGRADRGGRFERDNDRFDRPNRRPAGADTRYERRDARSGHRHTDSGRFDRGGRFERRDDARYSDRPRRRFDDRGGAPNHGHHVAGHADHRRQDRDDRARSNYLSRADEEAALDGNFDELVPVESKAAVDVDEANGFAAMGIPAPLVTALAERGIGAPFAIQVEAIPSALGGADVLARAATGSGKTLAFGLPTLTRLTGGTREPNRPRALVLTPTRELAMQVVDALAPLGKALDLRTLLVAGGMPYKKQLDSLDRGIDLLIATPGRLIDLIERGAADLSGIDMSVLDEADQMCDMGFAPEVRRILEETPADSQRMLFSATLDGDIDVLVKRFLTDPVLHSTADVGASIESMEHHLFVVHPARKAAIAAELASRPGRSIVFVRTKLGADRVAEKMREVGVNALAIHGGLSQGQRTRALNAFRGNHVPVLVATDVAARGIHIDDVELVIQADPPQEHKTYLHRAGRTARAGEDGTVVMLAMPRERRGAERLIGRAGVDLRGVYVEPGDSAIADITGGAQPSGEPVEEYRPPVKARPARGPRQGGGYRGRSGGFRGDRRGGDRRSFGDRRHDGGDRRGGGYRRDSRDSRGRRPDRHEA